MEFKGTKGNFSDGSTGWKMGERKTNGVDGFEIHWSDDGECVTDHVYTLEDAQLISASPDLLEALQEYLNAGHKEARRLASIKAKTAIAKALGNK